MTWNLFIDDERNPEDVTWASWHIREKYRNEEWENACNIWDVQMFMLRHGGFPSFVSFDHDLGADTYSGHDIAKFMVDADMMSVPYGFSENFDFYVHSKNPVGKANIEGLLNSYLKHKNSG